MTSKPTPGPWRADGKRILADIERGEYRVFAIAYLNVLDPNHEAKANAGFIVRACNSHDDLLAALKLLLDQEQNLAGECGWCFRSPFGHCERATCPGVIARAALAKATGGQT